MGLFSRLFAREDKSPDIEVDEDCGVDSEYMIPEEPVDPDFKLGGMRVGIVYKDESGTRTRRIIRLKRLDASEYESYLHAFCELRKEDRTFLLSRILTLYDPAQGEILPEAAEFFGPYIEAMIEERTLSEEKSRYRSAWPILEALRHELQVLILVARADGRFVKAEQNLLLNYARTRAGDMGIPADDHALVVLRDWLKIQDPAEPDARLALRSLKDTPGALDAIWEVSELIAEIDGKVREEERASISEIRRTINEVVAQGA